MQDLCLNFFFLLTAHHFQIKPKTVVLIVRLKFNCYKVKVIMKDLDSLSRSAVDFLIQHYSLSNVCQV